MVGAIAVLTLGGCGGGSKAGTETFGTEKVEVRPDGRLLADPPLLSLADVAKTRAGSPEQTVTRLFYYAQWGSLPDLAGLYDPSVLRVVGLDEVTGAYAYARPSLATFRPRVVSTQRAGNRALVNIEVLSKTTPPVRDSLVLRQRDGEWTIAYDSQFDRLLRTYLRYRADGATRPVPTPNAVRSAETSAAAYRLLATRAALPSDVRKQLSGAASAPTRSTRRPRTTRTTRAAGGTSGRAGTGTTGP